MMKLQENELNNLYSLGRVTGREGGEKFARQRRYSSHVLVQMIAARPSAFVATCVSSLASAKTYSFLHRDREYLINRGRDVRAFGISGTG